MISNVIIGFLITNIPPSFFSLGNKFFTLLFLGIFLSVALILPGVSVSYILLIFNMYDDIILAIKNLDIIYLLEIGMFLVIGLLLVIKLLHYLILKKKEMISNVIIGFIISSVWIVLPKFISFNDFVYFLIFVIIGILIKKVIPNDN
jgi:putative membrane protein